MDTSRATSPFATSQTTVNRPALPIPTVSFLSPRSLLCWKTERPLAHSQQFGSMERVPVFDDGQVQSSQPVTAATGGQEYYSLWKSAVHRSAVRSNASSNFYRTTRENADVNHERRACLQKEDNVFPLLVCLVLNRWHCSSVHEMSFWHHSLEPMSQLENLIPGFQ